MKEDKKVKNKENTLLTKKATKKKKERITVNKDKEITLRPRKKERKQGNKNLTKKNRKLTKISTKNKSKF